MGRLILGSLFAFEDNSQVTDDDPTMLESESNSASSRCEVGLAGDCALGKYGGARRDRTADLLRARQALSQLSYGP